MKIFKNKLAVVVIILSVCFLSLIGYSVKQEKVSLIEDGVGSVINSVQGLVYRVGTSIKNSAGDLFRIGSIKKENEELRAENERLKSNATQNEVLRNENSKLRSMLSFANTNDAYDYIGVDIIGLSGNNFLDGYIINKGESDGIKKGMVAIEGKGLVGQVTSVSENWSVVQSLCNANIAVAGYVPSTEESDGIVKGYQGNEESFLTEISGLSITSTIKEGDTILTSGLGGIYPKGIMIGTVKSVYEDKAKVVKSAIVKPAVEFNKIEQLLIVVPKDSEDGKY